MAAADRVVSVSTREALFTPLKFAARWLGACFVRRRLLL